MRYKDGDLLSAEPHRSPFNQYAFLTDDKFAHAVKVRNGEVNIDLSVLYPDISLPETLANLLGSPLRSKTADSATFVNGRVVKTNPRKMTEDEKLELIQMLRPCLWWGEE